MMESAGNIKQAKITIVDEIIKVSSSHVISDLSREAPLEAASRSDSVGIGNLY